MNETQKALLKWLLTINLGKNKKIIRIFGVFFLNTSGVSSFKKIWLTRHLWLGNNYYKNYIKTLQLSKRDPIPACAPCLVTKQTSLKTIAFYLPQFHPIEVNDRSWGKGFTEWSNTTTAVAQFEGHYQPRIPGELGYYDLRLKEIQQRQIELAKSFGISGFCYYHYWFDGQRVLEKPFNQVLKDKSLDLPFCLCWANENWTRAWDASEKEIILEQNHSDQDDILFFKDIIPALMDERYIRIDSKPLLIVYRPDLLPNPKKTAECWRALARQNGIGEIYLATISTRNFKDYRSIGFDALIQFPPHNLRPKVIPSEKLNLLNPKFSGRVCDYNEAVTEALTELKEHPNMIPGVMMGWDNEARRPGRSTIYHNCTPKSYQNWLINAIRHSMDNKTKHEQLVFINAWNEWAEGTYLEPDKQHGYDYLKATAEAINTTR